MFAAINHPTELEINPNDMAQAIAVTDMLGTDFKSFVKIMPEYKDLYERVFDFFKEHLGKVNIIIRAICLVCQVALINLRK